MKGGGNLGTCCNPFSTPSVHCQFPLTGQGYEGSLCLHKPSGLAPHLLLADLAVVLLLDLSMNH